MDVFGEIRESLIEILDIEPEEVTPETYVIRDLNAESIDLLELSVALNSRFRVEINDNEIYLKNLRACAGNGNGGSRNRGVIAPCVSKEFPYLGKRRVSEIISDLEGGPVLKVKDLEAYVSWKLGRK